MLQLQFSKRSFVRTLPEVPADFMKEYGKLSARMQYAVDYGWKQSLSDAYAAAKDEKEFEAKLFKRFDAIVAGTVWVSDSGGRGPNKSPLEREIFRLAGIVIDNSISAKGLKVAKAAKEQYVEMYVQKNIELLTADAEKNLAKNKEMAPVDLTALGL